jgi:hypothetical protein
VTLLIALWISSMPQAAAPPVAPLQDLLHRIACAPVGLPAPPVPSMRVLGGYTDGRIMFGPGDALIVGGGAGVQKGQQYYVRRLVTDASVVPPKVGAIYGIHTAGWVTIVDVKDVMSIATVTHACEGILEGDYLEPFVPPALPPGALTGAPDYEHPGHIVLADELRQTGYPGLVMVMDRGVDDGVRGGHVLTIYRDTLGGQGPRIDVGRATVISTGAKSSLVRIDSSRDAVNIGDLVAIHRITQ